MIQVRVGQLRFSDGTELDLEPGAIVVIVGPNNVGKSEAIRNISSAIRQPEADRLVVPHVDIKTEGSEEQLEAWLAEHTTEYKRSDGRAMVSRVGVQQQKNVIVNEWRNGPSLRHFGEMLSIVAMAEERLSLTRAVPSYATRSEHPTNALQHLYSQPDAEQRLSDAIREAFGTGIVVDRFGGSQIYLLYGEQPATPAGSPPSNEYLDELKALKQVDQQGDGVRSFTGLAMAVGTGVYPLVIIDEPEAFLHPPQARLLGRRLATNAEDSTQVFVSTHSADLVQGLIEANPGKVNVVRLTREGDINPTSVLLSADLESLWQDPILRYSNVLDGLFHDRVVVCESDGDCRFYGAAFDAIDNASDDRKPEVLFTQAGGKARLHVVASALRAVAVPVSIVADIDILRSPADLRRNVEALGADWTDFEAAATSIKSIVDSQASETLVEQILRDVHDVLDPKDPKSRALPEDVSAARSKLKVIDGWARLKESGVSGMVKGEATKDLNGLLKRLAQIGLHIVPVGELEGFDRELGGHGPQWVARALERGSHKAEQARQFIGAVVGLPRPRRGTAQASHVSQDGDLAR